MILGLDLSADKLLWSHPNCQIISLLHLQIYSIFEGYILIVGVTLPLTRVLCNSRYRSAEFELHAIKFCWKRIFWLLSQHILLLSQHILVGWPCSCLRGGGASIFFPSWPQQIPLDFARSCWKIKTTSESCEIKFYLIKTFPPLLPLICCCVIPSVQSWLTLKEAANKIGPQPYPF